MRSKKLHNVIGHGGLVIGIALWAMVSAHALSIDEAVEKIVSTSPEVGVLFEKREQAYENYKDSRSLYNPKIAALYERTYLKDQPIFDPSNGTWNGTNKLQLTLTQRIFDMPAYAQINAAKQEIQSEEYRNRQLLEATIQNAVTAYYDVIQAEYSVSVTKDYLRQVKEIERLIIFMYRNGDATLGDVNFTQARVASSNATLIGSYGTLDSVRVRLAYLLGLITPDQSINAADVLPELSTRDFFDLGDRMISLIPATVEELQQMAVNNSLDVLLERSDLCTRQYRLDGQLARYMPRANLYMELTDEEVSITPEFNRYGKIRFDFTYDIYDGGSRTAAIKGAQSSVREVENRYAASVRDIRDASFTAYNQLKSLEEQKSSLLSEIEATEEVDKIYNLQFKFATRHLNDRLDNVERLYYARINLLNTDYSILKARLAILGLTGRMIDFFDFGDLISQKQFNLC